MCAIAGIIDLFCDDTVKKRLLKTMERRGPDGYGAYDGDHCCLLHSRLAVIDLDGGKQPMQLTWDNCCYWITYNGELYNTDDIRKELMLLGHTFRGYSDTEVVLHAYAQWKADALNKLNGIFAFGIWENNSRKLFLARDRIGVKPLFYFQRKDCLVFSSEIKTIFDVSGCSNKSFA